MTKHVCFISGKIHNFIFNDAESAGGAERQQYLIANCLQQQGYEISFITSTTREKRCEKKDGFTIWNTYPVIQKPTVTAFVSLLIYIYSLYQVSADYYYVRGLPRQSIIVAIFSRLSRSKYIYCIANESNISDVYLCENYNWITRMAYRWSLQEASVVISQNADQHEKLREGYDVESVTIPNGSEIAPKHALVNHEDRDYVLWVGRIRQEQKHPERVLKLARRLPNIQFKIVGPKEGKAQYVSEIIGECERRDNVDYEGFVDPEEIGKYYQNAIALLNTSDYEGFPNTFLEAWQYEVPVISMYYSMDNLFKIERIGYQTGDIEQTSRCLSTLVENPEVRSRVGRRARAFTIENYSLSTICDRYAEVFS